MESDTVSEATQYDQMTQRSPEMDAVQAMLYGTFAVSVWDRGNDEFRPVWVNEAYTALTGYTAEEALALGEDLLRPGYRPALAEMVDDHSAGAQPIHASMPLVTAEGKSVDVPVSITVRKDPGTGRATRLIAVQREVATPSESLLPESHSRRALELVAKISELLVDFDEPKVLDSIARLVGRRLHTWVGFIVDAGVLRLSEDINEHVRARRTGAARGQTSTDLSDPVARLLARDSPDPVTLQMSEVFSSGSPAGQLVELVRSHVRVDAHSDRLLVYPLLGRGRTLGVMAALPEVAADHFGQDMQTVLYLCARRVGMALDNAQLHYGEHQLVETLQRSMLPDQSQIEDLDVWTYYTPSSEHAQVGGDWYDVTQLPEDITVLVIGDVAGHDIEAAAAMGQLRSVVRAFGADLHDPAEVLSRVDRIVDSMRIGRATSLIYATLSRVPDSADWELRYSRAGHMPGLLVRDGQVRELDGAGGRLVGFGATTRATAAERLHPGDVLVMYTDGLVERRNRPLPQGIAALREVLSRGEHRDAAMVGEMLVRELATDPEDDVAVVVMRIPEQISPSDGKGRQRHWRFPAAKESVRLAREAAAAACRAWGLRVHNAVELVVSELVANAVLHGGGTVTVNLVDTGEGVRVEVEDENPMPPVPLEIHPARVGGYGMHIVSRLADWGWRPSGAGKVVWARISPNLDGTGL